MDKFWGSIAALVIIATILVLIEVSDDVFVRDLEVECEADKDEYNQIRLDGRTLKFEGAFPEDEKTTELSYDFTKRGEQVTLKIESQETSRQDFVDTCRKVKVYKLEKKMDPGVYDIEVFHGSEKVSDQRIRIL